MTADEAGMRAALEQARLASLAGEIPVGAALTDGEGRILAAAHNRREETNDPLSHAEAEVLRQAAGARESRYFTDCTLYVTLEPCPMCAGALIAARVGRVVFGAKDPRAGAFGSLLDLTAYPLEFRPDVCGGVLAGECLAPLRAFFAGKRKSSIN
ncbi:MAG: nucleoside deaminase [Eubacteriales bacterium]|nr:nucleoside deaminase [Eubacteriales bacterium]